MELNESKLTPLQSFNSKPAIPPPPSKYADPRKIVDHANRTMVATAVYYLLTEQNILVPDFFVDVTTLMIGRLGYHQILGPTIDDHVSKMVGSMIYTTILGAVYWYLKGSTFSLIRLLFAYVATYLYFTLIHPLLEKAEFENHALRKVSERIIVNLITFGVITIGHDKVSSGVEETIYFILADAVYHLFVSPMLQDPHWVPKLP